ncbi:MAG: hypothetical protein JWP18_2232, partial [Solirubrobacterales bacterium]|nr:hypothetical protein [Solirubrobacterales bacterium]
MTGTPRARTAGLLTEELDGEVIVFDQDNNVAHSLSAQTVAV